MIAFLGTRLILFTCLSFFLSSAIFITSFLEFGDLSFWLDVFSTGVAIIYHVAIVILSWHASLTVAGNPKLLKSGYPPAYTMASITVLSTILVAVVGALVVKIEVAVVSLHPSTPQTAKDPQTALLVILPILLAMELGIIVLSLSHTFKERTRIQNKNAEETQFYGDGGKASMSSYEKLSSTLDEAKGFNFVPPKIRVPPSTTMPFRPSVATNLERKTPWSSSSGV